MCCCFRLRTARSVLCIGFYPLRGTSHIQNLQEKEMNTAGASSTMDQLKSLDEAFKEWLTKAEMLCYMAVYRSEKDFMELLWRDLLQKADAITKVRLPLEGHLDKLSKTSAEPILPALALVDTAPAPAQKLTNALHASLPGINENSAVLPASSSGSSAEAVKPAPVPFKAVMAQEVQAASGDTREDGGGDSEWSTVVRKHKAKETRAGQPERSTDAKAHKGRTGDGSQPEDAVETVDSKRIFLIQVSRDQELDTKAIAEYFMKFGPVVDVRIFRNLDGSSRGCASVEFLKESSVQAVLKEGRHYLDGREVQVKTFFNREGMPKGARYNLFLGGVPTFLTALEVKQAVEKVTKVKDMKLNAERGFALIELAHESDLAGILKTRFMKIGEKMVECRECIRK